MKISVNFDEIWQELPGFARPSRATYIPSSIIRDKLASSFSFFAFLHGNVIHTGSVVVERFRNRFYLKEGGMVFKFCYTASTET
jgi:hypothetical protein